jgi:hypothetical protein
VKSFEGVVCLLTMLYAASMGFDSRHEIGAAMRAQVCKLRHIGIDRVAKRVTLSDANGRRAEGVFTLFSNAIFKGVGRHPKTGRWKGGIKLHSVIHANEGVRRDVKFTSASTIESFMPAPSHFHHEEIVALDRAFINIEKLEELTERNLAYVTKMKKRVKYEVLADCTDMNSNGKME